MHGGRQTASLMPVVWRAWSVPSGDHDWLVLRDEETRVQVDARAQQLGVTLKPLVRKEEAKLEAAAAGEWDMDDENAANGALDVPADESEQHEQALKALAEARDPELTVRASLVVMWRSRS